ncbi:MAG: InlB B-repeat-containing protein [Paludibacteraceae bacterium]|nr:InlB B-repeat-containing protein [Paludibacteraceae bacterium]
MRKFLLSIVAAIMAVGAWADDGCMDTIPAERCISNFNLDLHTNTLCFVDNYRTDVAFDREYFIMVYDRSSNDLENGCKFSTQLGIQGNLTYVYASENGGEAKKCYSDAHLVLNSHGGLVCFSEDAVRNMIRSLYQNGSKEVIFIIDPYRNIKDDITGQTTLNSYYSGVRGSTGAEVWNLSYINYFTCSLPNPLTFELTSPASTVRYGEDIELNCAVQAAGQARVVFSESDQPDGDQRVIYDYTLSASEAGAGKVVSYHKSFIDDDMPATRYYHVALWLPDGKAGEQSTSLNFQYPLTINSGTPSYYSPGEQITVPKSDCGAYSVRTVNNVPVQLEDLGANYRLTMPACAVWLNEKPTQYTVQFRDYDNTVLKTEKVACGSDATPPTPPTHAGMTFTGWDKPYTDIRANQVIRARYKYEGIEAELTCTSTIAMQGENITFHVRVKTPTSIATRAYLDAAWIDDETDEVNFGSAVSTVDFSKEEAAAGTTKSLDVTVLPTGVNNYGHRARYFRLRIRFSGSTQDYYFNIARIDTYYPIVISGDIVALSDLANGTTMTAGNGETLYSRPQDTIRAVSEVTACSLKFQWHSISQDVDAGDYWVVVPAGSGENMLTVSREKHHVSFYLAGKQVYNPGEYEPQEITCGEAATPPDVIAKVPEGKLFRGWKARGEYADDAYNYVTEDMIFDAVLEDNPEGIEQIPVPQDKARKYMINGQIYIALPDGKVFDLRGLRVR